MQQVGASMIDRVLAGRGIGRVVLWLLLLHAVPSADAYGAAAGGVPSACAPEQNLQFICGPVASEDLVRVPGTRWLIASGLNIGTPAHLYLIDTKNQRFAVAFPVGMPRMQVDRAVTPDCNAPPDLSRMSTDGLALRPGSDGRHTLYAANHGDRMAIEVFDVDARSARPQLRWVGCMLLPARALPNGVAALPDGGILVTNFYDPAGREASGGLLEWHAASGFRNVPDASFSGANGIEINADASAIYVSAWAARKIIVLSRKGGAGREIPLPFMPDNIHRLPDGSLLVGGQQSTVEKIAACKAECPQPWVVARVDPEKSTVQTLLEGQGTRAVNYAAGGLLVDGTLYVTARGDRRIIFVPMPATRNTGR
jgi:hypothetical protein